MQIFLRTQNFNLVKDKHSYVTAQRYVIYSNFSVLSPLNNENESIMYFFKKKT
jgi:hypothetical protein